MNKTALGAVTALTMMLTPCFAQSGGAQGDFAEGIIAHQREAARDIAAPFASLSYSPFVRDQTPADEPTAAQIRIDLELLAPYTRTVRIYAPENGLEKIVPIAESLGFKVILGVWLTADDAHNERQIEAALDLARKHSNVRSLLIGNETTLHAKDPAPVVRKLVRLLKRVRPRSPVPVSTAEFWHIWRDHPELVEATDFIAAHVLPYWEHVAGPDAVDYALSIHGQLKAAYPDSRILIAEFGWPSAGFESATDGQLVQANVLRDFAKRARAKGVEYNLIEAFDQPWKTHEGPVGGHWGMFNADREPKLVIDGLVY